MNQRSFSGRRLTCVFVAGLMAAASVPFRAQAAHPHALWHVVHDLCMTDRRLTGLSAPCLEVNLAEGYAVVPDPKKAAHLLLVPTRPLTGIEDPRLMEPGAPNYWRRAWSARRHLDARVGRPPPREAVGLAVNAIPGRSQDQLHIHISCIQPALAEALKALEPRLGPRWSTHKINRRSWRIRTMAGEEPAADPFRLLADLGPAVGDDMGNQTIVVAGGQLRAGPGFYVLSRSANAATGDQGHGEFMLDERCSAAAPLVEPSGQATRATAPRPGPTVSSP